MRDYHVRHLKLIFDINAGDHSAHGIVTNYLAALNDGLAKVTLDAGANLKIESVKIDGNVAPYTHAGDKLTIIPPAPLTKGKEIAIEITYTMPQTNVGGGANGSGGFKWIDPRPNDPERKPEFWTQGETETNHKWVPCYDFPNDKCTSETHTTVPDNWIVIGNGEELPATHDAAKKTITYHWRMTQPHSTYLLSLAGGELDVKTAKWEGVPLYYVVPRGKADMIDASFGNTPDMLSFFSSKLGVKYPWPKYAQDAMYDFGGGMENVSATTLGQGALTDRRAGIYRMSSLNAHELSHQWFGDLVTCAFWGDAWLNESFATYFEQLYLEHSQGKDVFDSERDSALHSYLSEAARYQRPLSTTLYTNGDVMFDRHTYPKGGLILHMIRRRLGDRKFFHALGHYLNKHKYQPVIAADLQNAITEDSGVDMKPFFDQWIFKPGHPVLDATWQYDDASKTEQVTVKQTQEINKGIPVYNTPLTIGLLYNNEGRGRIERQTVTLNSLSQTFRLAASERPDAILIDPDHDLLKQINEDHWADSELPALLRLAPCVTDRRRAANAFAGDTAKMDDMHVQTLVAALVTDKSEESAANLIRLLGETKRENLRPLFLQQAQSNQTDRRAAAVTALGQLPPTRESQFLIRSLAKSDIEAYQVVRSALVAMSKYDIAENLDIYKHQIEIKSLRSTLASAAVEALSESKNEAAAPLLLEAASKEGLAMPVRENAISACGELAPGNPAVHETLLRLAQDNAHANLQTAAINALKERNDKDAVGALRALATSATDANVRDLAKDTADALEAK